MLNTTAVRSMEHNPAASYAFGAYCWSAGIDPVELYNRPSRMAFLFHLDPETAKFAVDLEDKVYVAYCEALGDEPDTSEFPESLL